MPILATSSSGASRSWPNVLPIHFQPASHTLSRALKGVLCALSLCLAAGTALAAQTDDAVVSAARMLDVRTGRMLQDVSVVVRDGRIEKVVQGGDAGSVGEGLPHYDLGDMTLLPGLIDMHVHLDSDPTYGGYTGLQFNDRFWSVLAVEHAQRTLQAGFTTQPSGTCG